MESGPLAIVGSGLLATSFIAIRPTSAKEATERIVITLQGRGAGVSPVSDVDEPSASTSSLVILERNPIDLRQVLDG